MTQEQMESLPLDLVDKLRLVPTATASYALQKLGIRRPAMRGVYPLAPMGVGNRAVGRAITVRYLPVREDLQESMMKAGRWAYAVRQAMQMLGPSDVLVIDAMGLGAQDGGVMGDIMGAYINYRGAAAVVTDGAVRDSPFLSKMGLRIFCKGVHADDGAYLHADMNVMVQCGGILVVPGDVILGDDEGVIVIPRSMAAKVADVASERDDLELFIRNRIEQGVPLPEIYPPTEAVLQEYRRSRGASSKHR